MRVVADNHPAAGQSGQLLRVFWRAETAWILMRTRGGSFLALPWSATDLPIPIAAEVRPPRPSGLLTPTALVALLRRLRHRPSAAPRAPLLDERREP